MEELKELTPIENDNYRIQQLTVHFQDLINKFDELKYMIISENNNGYIHIVAMRNFERLLKEFESLSESSLKGVYQIKMESDRDLRDCKQAYYEDNFDANMYIKNGGK